MGSIRSRAVPAANGDERDRRKHERHRGEDERIPRLHPVERRRDHACEEERRGQADDDADDRQDHALEHDHVLDLVRLRPERETDPDLLRPLLYE